MTVKSGSHSIGPANGRLTLSTYVGGAGAKMGHDLVLEAKSWSGTANLDSANPAGSSVQVTVDLTSLSIASASGGIKPLSDKDRAEIAQNTEKTLNTKKFPQVTFQSTSVSGSGSSFSVAGNLTLAGTTKVVTLALAVTDGGSMVTITGKTQIVQTAFGIKPYSKLGVLKIKDEVDLEVTLNLPAA
ncbi:MAG: YceI family protein [Acidimicrobiales bacterium]